MSACKRHRSLSRAKRYIEPEFISIGATALADPEPEPCEIVKRRKAFMISSDVATALETMATSTSEHQQSIVESALRSYIPKQYYI